ncbi:unnamed protein product [Symbiodinium natans]|uniref:Uncharacterized protein n=1 Tax=Symbiodinium natans TaxID=878477 RepID=A0A812L5P1_9DINO|nr:unnamed protein product [Symbiodinium natans]
MSAPPPARPAAKAEAQKQRRKAQRKAQNDLSAMLCDALRIQANLDRKNLLPSALGGFDLEGELDMDLGLGGDDDGEAGLALARCMNDGRDLFMRSCRMAFSCSVYR